MSTDVFEKVQGFRVLCMESMDPGAVSTAFPVRDCDTIPEAEAAVDELDRDHCRMPTCIGIHCIMQGEFMRKVQS